MLSFLLPNSQTGERAKLLSNLGLTIFTIVIVGINVLVPSMGRVAAATSITIEGIVEQHNLERQKLGLPPLKINAELNNSALQKARAMLETNCWSHYCPPGKSPWDFFSESGYKYLYAGENLAEGFSTVSDMMVAWMNSPTHKANIIRPEYEEIGVAMIQGNFQGQADNIIVTVHFGTPASSVDIEPGTNQPILSELPKPEIIEPSNNSFINTPNLTIRGEAPEATEVDIFDNTIEWVTTNAEDGIFTYHITDLAERAYSINVISVIGARHSQVSDTVNFTVDLTPEQISGTQILVSQRDQNGNIKIDISHKNLSKLELRMEDQTLPFYQVSSSIWRLSMNLASIPKGSDFTINTEDMAGNTWRGGFSSNIIYDQLPQVPITYTSEKAAGGMDIVTIINWVIIVSVILLFIIDFLVLSSTGLTNPKAKSHLHVGLLIILIIVAISGSFFGQVGTGLNI